MQPLRPATALCVVQVTIIVAGLLTLSLVLKALGWGEPGMERYFGDLASFLRLTSGGMLLLPLGWVIWTLWLENSGRSDLWLRVSLGLGIGLCAVLLLAYGSAALHPRMMLF